MKINNLTIKQEAFCQAFIKSGEATAAYKEAGYSWKNRKSTFIHEAACKIHKNIKVASRIKELQEKLSIIAEEKFNITAETILRHLDILRNARIDQYVTFIYEKMLIGYDEEDNPEYKEEARMIFKPFSELTQEQLMCIESIKQNRYGEIELKLHGKEWTIEKINKHIGFYEKDNVQRSVSIPIMSIDPLSNNDTDNSTT